MDITTLWNTQAAHGDYMVVQAWLGSGSDLETAVLISLFSDRLANVDDVIVDSSDPPDPRGWACDDLTQPIGSRLWLLERSTNNSQVPVDAKIYCTEALQWLITDGIAEKIDITCELQSPNGSGPKIMLAIQIVVWQQGQPTTFRYAYAWQQLTGSQAGAPPVAGPIVSKSVTGIGGGRGNVHTHH